MGRITYCGFCDFLPLPLRCAMAAAAHQELDEWLRRFDSALLSGDAASVAELFHPDECFWRDLLSFTWNIYTAESRAEIQAMLEATLAATEPSQWRIHGQAEKKDDGVVEAFITFETRVARGKGFVKVKEGRCWCLLTTMKELKGHEEKAGGRRVIGAEYGNVKGKRTWLDGRAEEEAELGITAERQPYCLIVGGGQAGITLGARLRRLGVPAIILEKNARAGDSWRKRYKSLCLHDTVWYDHLPYLPFPDHWPIFTPKDKIADWLEAYVSIMELVYWTSSECVSAQFDAAADRWEVVVRRRRRRSSHGGASDGHDDFRIFPTHLVLATGMSGLPNVPRVPGAQLFRGVQLHSSQFPGGAAWRGKRCVVVGANNSAHDVCADLWENDAASVTMVQRSSTHVLRQQTVLSGLPTYYKEGAPHTTEEADILNAAVPYKIMHRDFVEIYKRIKEENKEFYEGLRRRGFKLDFGDDESGLFMKYLRRGSGYYIDTGASELLLKGEIGLRSGADVVGMKENAVVLSDGSEEEADLVVYATGYGSMNGWAAELISKEVADKVGKCWGLGSGTTKDPGPWERELRNMWKPTQQRGLWFHGGNLHQCRYYSLFVALQIKARMEGIATPVFGMPDQAYHTS